MDKRKALAESLIALGDDHLILGHRLSEWCGHAPMLEEDLSLPNMALDLLGQARNLYTYAGELEGKGRGEDDFAFLRTDREYKNLLLVERPNGDFAHTMLRQFYFAAFMEPYWQQILSNSSDETLRGIAGKAAKEMAYHIRHTGEWIIRLGDGTEESAKRVRAAVDALHHYTNELFTLTDAMRSAVEDGALPNPETIKPIWSNTIEHVFSEAFLTIPDVPFPQQGGREGHHTEAFGHLLSELQYMQRTYPGMTW
ncbi:MAG: 1,2-phenylacetyl-CoA epoxidase subunit PaaC [Pseudomonadota bacterium]